MKRKLSAFTKLASLALALLPCAAAHAATVTFASFNDTGANNWVYSNGNITASADNAIFVGFPGPSQVINFIGPVTYDVTATASGAATLSGGVISQQIDGEMTFKSGANTVLDVIFSGALITGNAGSNSTGLAADTQISGNVISYSTAPGFQVAPFVGPYSFSIALTQTPGLAINGTNLADFTATASGTFSTNTELGGGSPTPLPHAAFGGLALIGAAALGRRVRQKAIA